MYKSSNQLKYYICAKNIYKTRDLEQNNPNLCFKEILGSFHTFLVNINFIDVPWN